MVFDKMSSRLPEKLLRSIASYIDENYIETHEDDFYAPHRKMRREMDYIERACVSEAIPMPCAPKAISLEDMLKQEDAGFTETLLRLIDESGKKDSQIYKKALLSKQHFSKIRNNPNYKPTKATAVALALALELDLEATKDLIGRAGYALTNSSKFDLIIRYHIENGIYNLVQINMALYEFDQSLLGS